MKMVEMRKTFRIFAVFTRGYTFGLFSLIESEKGNGRQLTVTLDVMIE